MATAAEIESLILERRRDGFLQIYEPEEEDDLSPVTQAELNARSGEMGGCLEPCERCGAGVRVFFDRCRNGRGGAFVYRCRCGLEILFNPVQ